MRNLATSLRAAVNDRVLVCLLACIAPISDRATEFYVSAAGSDANPGTLAQPWQTIEKANATRFLPGDRILLEGGATFTGNVKLFDEAGTSASPIVVSSYGQGRATIDAGDGFGIKVYNAAGFEIRNLRIVGSGYSTNQGSGINFYMDLTQSVRMPYIRIDDVEITGFSVRVVNNTVNGTHGWGIVLQSDSPGGAAGYTDICITKVKAYGNTMGGITTGSRWDAYPPGPGFAFSNVYVGYSSVYDNSGLPGFANHSGNGILVSGVDGAVIEHNVAYNNGYVSAGTLGGPYGIWTSVANNVIIQYNESYANRTKGLYDGGGFDLDGGVTNSIVQYNYSHDNDGAGILLCHFTDVRAWSDNIVRYNISQNDGRKNSFGGITMWSGGSGLMNSQIYNNTITVNGASSGTPAAVLLMTTTKNTSIRNNLLLAAGTARVLDIAGGQTNLVVQGNDYWSYTGTAAINWAGTIYNSVTAWQSATGQEMYNGVSTALNLDPQISVTQPAPTINDTDSMQLMPTFRLASTSPAINKGLDLRVFGVDAGPRDFFGTSLSQSSMPDIGAHEAVFDVVSPSSRVAGFTVTPGSRAVILTWAGNDNSGIASFTIYTSVNGARFIPWLTDTKLTQASFTVAAGTSYMFFSVARDLAGNREPMKNSAEVSLTISTAGTTTLQCPTLQ